MDVREKLKNQIFVKGLIQKEGKLKTNDNGYKAKGDV